MSMTTSPQPTLDFLSPLKRKRAAPPAPDTREIPETPWRTTNPPTVPTPTSSPAASSSVPSSTSASPDAQSYKLIASMRRMKLQHTSDSEAVVVTDDEEDTEQLQDAGKPKRRRASREAEPPEDGKEHGIPGKEKRLRSPPPEVPIEAVEKEEDEDEEMGSSDVDGYGIAYIPTPAQRDLRRQKRLAAIKEYKSRETKDARAKRAEERRRRRRSSTLVAGGSSAGEEPPTGRGVSEERPRKAVHFAE